MSRPDDHRGPDIMPLFVRVYINLLINTNPLPLGDKRSSSNAIKFGAFLGREKCTCIVVLSGLHVL